jgi:hypothetical protein
LETNGYRTATGDKYDEKKCVTRLLLVDKVKKSEYNENKWGKLFLSVAKEYI